MTQIHVRAAKRSDLETLVRIYNRYVETSHVTLDTEPFSAAGREAWFNAFAEDGPHRLFVAEVSGTITGYTSSAPLKEKAGYTTSVETSVYIDSRFAGQGIGRELYQTLLTALRAEPSVHRAYGVIGVPNTPSIKLHEELGFIHVGTLHEAGRKFDQFWDVVWYEMDLSTSHRVALGKCDPPEIRPIF